MRLSDAIAVGRTLVSRCVAGGSTSYRAKPGDGCVLDMAALAVGLRYWKDVGEVWPWVLDPDPANPTGDYREAIYSRFDCEVMGEKSLTLDQLIDWIRSVEPNEAEEPPQAQSVPLAVAEGAHVER
jgi:hypothetical protein